MGNLNVLRLEHVLVAGLKQLERGREIGDCQR